MCKGKTNTCFFYFFFILHLPVSSGIFWALQVYSPAAGCEILSQDHGGQRWSAEAVKRKQRGSWPKKRIWDKNPLLDFFCICGLFLYFQAACLPPGLYTPAGSRWMVISSLSFSFLQPFQPASSTLSAPFYLSLSSGTIYRAPIQSHIWVQQTN